MSNAIVDKYIVIMILLLIATVLLTPNIPVAEKADDWFVAPWITPATLTTRTTRKPTAATAVIPTATTNAIQVLERARAKINRAKNEPTPTMPNPPKPVKPKLSKNQLKSVLKKAFDKLINNCLQELFEGVYGIVQNFLLVYDDCYERENVPSLVKISKELLRAIKKCLMPCLHNDFIICMLEQLETYFKLAGNFLLAVPLFLFQFFTLKTKCLQEVRKKVGCALLQTIGDIVVCFISAKPRRVPTLGSIMNVKPRSSLDNCFKLDLNKIFGIESRRRPV